MKNPKTPKDFFINDIQSDKDYKLSKEEGIKTGYGFINPRKQPDLTVNKEDYEVNQPTPGLLY